MKIGLVGDVMLGHTGGGFSKLGISGFMAAMGARRAFGNTLPSLHDMDLNLFNHEFVATERAKDPAMCCKFRAPTAISIDALLTAKLGVALVANNHLKDFGDDAATDTLRSLETAGIVSSGANFESAAEWKPRIIDVPGKPLRIAVLALMRSESAGPLHADRVLTYEKDGPPWVHTVQEKCFVEALSPCGRLLRERLRAARHSVTAAGGANLTILSVHWGNAQSSKVLREDCLGPFMPHHLPFRDFVREVLSNSKLKIDLFLTNHPYNFQTYQTVAGKPVVNSPVPRRFPGFARRRRLALPTFKPRGAAIRDDVHVPKYRLQPKTRTYAPSVRRQLHGQFSHSARPGKGALASHAND